MLPAHSLEPQHWSLFWQGLKRGEHSGGGGAWQIAPLQVKSRLQQGRAPTTQIAVTIGVSIRRPWVFYSRQILEDLLPSGPQMGSGSGTAQNPAWQVKPAQQGSLAMGLMMTARRQLRMVHAPGQGLVECIGEDRGRRVEALVPPSTTHVGGGVTIGPVEDVVLVVLELLVLELLVLELLVLELLVLELLLLEDVEEVDELDTVDDTLEVVRELVGL